MWLVLLLPLLFVGAEGSFEYVDSQKDLRHLTEEEEDFVLVLWTAKTCKVLTQYRTKGTLLLEC